MYDAIYSNTRTLNYQNYANNYKTVIKQLVLKKRSCYFFTNSVLLKDFDKTKLKIVKHDCVDRYVYHIDYAKNINNVNPLYLIIPGFYGYIEKHEGRKYSNIALTGMNNDVLSEYEKIWDGILEKKIIIKLK